MNSTKIDQQMKNNFAPVSSFLKNTLGKTYNAAKTKKALIKYVKPKDHFETLKFLNQYLTNRLHRTPTITGEQDLKAS